MADLTGVELDLAVARAMGRRISTVQPLAGGGVTAGWIDPHKVDAAHCTWRPSQGGAAAWGVLEWVRQQGWDVGLRCVELCLDSDEPVTESALCTLRATRPVRECQATGPTDAIALCRAVVALGEAL